jgi:hypothetical protein
LAVRESLALKQQHPPREEVRRVSFWGPILGRRWGSALFVIAGEEVGFDEILFAFLKGAKPLKDELRSLWKDELHSLWKDELRSLWKQRPPREEVRRAPFWWSTLGRR